MKRYLKGEQSSFAHSFLHRVFIGCHESAVLGAAHDSIKGIPPRDEHEGWFTEATTIPLAHPTECCLCNVGI